MKRPPNYLFVLFAIVLFVVPSVIAYNPVSFCKCICFNNATIIPISDPTDKSKPCADCTRQFCLDYHLPICRGASNDPTHGDDTVIVDISTVCFRISQGYWADVERDSRKDQLIVVLFLIITTGLLVYALIRPYVQSWLARTSSARQTQGGSQSQEYETLPM